MRDNAYNLLRFNNIIVHLHLSKKEISALVVNMDSISRQEHTRPLQPISELQSQSLQPDWLQHSRLPMPPTSTTWTKISLYTQTYPYVFLGLMGLPSAILPTAYRLARAESVRFFGGSLCWADPRSTISVSSSWAGRRRLRSNRRKYTIFSVLCLQYGRSIFKHSINMWTCFFLY